MARCDLSESAAEPSRGQDGRGGGGRGAGDALARSARFPGGSQRRGLQSTGVPARLGAAGSARRPSGDPRCPRRASVGAAPSAARSGWQHCRVHFIGVHTHLRTAGEYILDAGSVACASRRILGLARLTCCFHRVYDDLLTFWYSGMATSLSPHKPVLLSSAFLARSKILASSQVVCCASEPILRGDRVDEHSPCVGGQFSWWIPSPATEGRRPPIARRLRSVWAVAGTGVRAVMRAEGPILRSADNAYNDYRYCIQTASDCCG